MSCGWTRAKENHDVQISHQTGERTMASFAHTTEFMNWLRAAMAVQIIYAQVPTFHACRCQGSGIKTMTKERKEATGMSGYAGSSIVVPRRRLGTAGRRGAGEVEGEVEVEDGRSECHERG